MPEGISCAALLLAVAFTVSGAEQVERRPGPDWIKPCPIPEGFGEAADGIRCLLVDQQVNASTATRFAHYAREITNPRGVQDGSRITVSFDPSYQTLSLNQLLIHRGGEKIDRLQSQPVRILSRERAMEENLYDGSVTAVLDIEDVRPGDVIEYALTLSGENPVFKGRYSEFVTVAWPIPIARQQFRLLWPADRRLDWKQSTADEIDHEESTNGGLTEHVWSQSNIRQTVAEDNIPPWFAPFGWIQLSEWKDWVDVARWAEEFYQIPGSLPGEVESELEKLRALPSEEAQILGALEFAQNRIRYLSVSSGMHSHAPYPVEEVIRRGYGDCKDKARLLTAMLRELGFDASPALVNSVAQRTIDGWLPTPESFDHVIVRLVWNGHDYWLDPTAAHQGGPLASRYQPDYGKALVLDGKGASLTAVQLQGQEDVSIEVTETYRIPDYTSDVQLTVDSTHRGGEADWMRTYLALMDRQEVERNLLNYTTKLHAEAVQSSKPQFSDDAESNVLKSQERYRIASYFRPNPDTPGYLQASAYPYLIDAQTKEPFTRQRTMPIAVNHPKSITERFVFHIPPNGSFKNEDVTISDDAFEFRKTVDFRDDTLTVTHQYSTLQDSVDPARTSAYLKNLRSVREKLGYSIAIPESLANPDASPSSPATDDPIGRANWLFITIVVLTALFSAGLAIAGYFWRPNWPPPVDPPGPFGLKGWLILLGFGVVASPIRIIANAWPLFGFFDIETWQVLTTRGTPQYNSLWAPVLIFETVASIAFFFATVLGVALFFRKRRTFPPIFISILVVSTVFFMIDDLLAAHLLEDQHSPSANPLAPWIPVFIWVPYLLVSKRVRSTFVR